MEEATWFPLIVVVPKKNEKFQICMDFQKLNATMKKYIYPLPFYGRSIRHGGRTQSLLISGWIFGVSLDNDHPRRQ
jgi:hypothetical protein